MKVYENLLFQKQYFPHIYEKYKTSVKTEQEVSVSMEVGRVLDIKDEILCICEKFEPIIKNILPIPIELKEQIDTELDQFNSIIIHDSCEEKVNHFSTQGLLELYFTLPYFINNFKIRLERRPDRKAIKKAIKIIVTKDLDFFESMSLKGCEYETVLGDFNKLKMLFVNMRCFYKNKSLLSKLSRKTENADMDVAPVIKENHDVIISMKICEQISKDISQRKFNSADLLSILNTCMKEFTGKAIEILKTVIIECDFRRNYGIVETYLSISKDLEFKLRDFIGTTVANDISKPIYYSSNTNHTDSYLQLLNSKIVQLDNIIGDSLELVNKKVNEGIKIVN